MCVHMYVPNVSGSGPCHTRVALSALSCWAPPPPAAYPMQALRWGTAQVAAQMERGAVSERACGAWEERVLAEPGLVADPPGATQMEAGRLSRWLHHGARL